MDASTDAASLLVSICRCTNVTEALRDEAHPCRGVVTSQQSFEIADRQVPEPWVGHLGTAPILFLSSNPSISQIEVFPTGDWADAALVDFFDGRFDERPNGKAWIRNGTQTRLRDSEEREYSRSVAFLAAVRRRASELLERPAVPGIDYCLTEVVHCKSAGERGVREATTTCAERWLEPVLSASPAPVVVVLGSVAAEAVQHIVPRDGVSRVVGPIDLGGRARLVVFMPHPNARRKRTFTGVLEAGELQTLRSRLRAAGPASPS